MIYTSIYDPLIEAGWEKHSFKTACAAAGRTRASGLQGVGAALKKQPRTEIVWRNPAAIRASTGLKKKFYSWELN